LSTKDHTELKEFETITRNGLKEMKTVSTNESTLFRAAVASQKV